MDAKEAARTAKGYLVDLFADEEVKNVGLEEIEFDPCSRMWKITIGFSRPWDWRGGGNFSFEDVRPPARSYKVIRIDDENRSIESVKDRLMVDSG